MCTLQQINFSVQQNLYLSKWSNFCEAFCDLAINGTFLWITENVLLYKEGDFWCCTRHLRAGTCLPVIR